MIIVMNDEFNCCQQKYFLVTAKNEVRGVSSFLTLFKIQRENIT